jgi:hypothetical protein
VSPSRRHVRHILRFLDLPADEAGVDAYLIGLDIQGWGMRNHRLQDLARAGVPITPDVRAMVQAEVARLTSASPQTTQPPLPSKALRLVTRRHRTRDAARTLPR